MKKDRFKVGDAFEFRGKFFAVQECFDKGENQRLISERSNNGDRCAVTSGDGTNVRKLRVLTLNIKEPWFSMILSGEKLEEYRERKPFWNRRLLTKHIFKALGKDSHEYFSEPYRQYDVFRAVNGMAKDKKEFWAHHIGTDIGRGDSEWGAPDFDVFCISVGEIFATKNLKQ